MPLLYPCPLQNRYIKENSGIRVPLSIIKDEAQKLGIIARDPSAPPLEPRPVPKDPLEYGRARVAYNKAVKAMRCDGCEAGSALSHLTPRPRPRRAGLRAEVAAHDAAVEARYSEHKEAVLTAKAANAEKRRLERAARLAATAVVRKRERDTTALRKAQAGAKLSRSAQAWRARREVWLNNVEAEALRTWIPEDKASCGGAGGSVVALTSFAAPPSSSPLSSARSTR